jgi:hypothetical protein
MMGQLCSHARVVLFLNSYFAALFRLDVFIEVAPLTSTELIHGSSARHYCEWCIFDPTKLSPRKHGYPNRNENDSGSQNIVEHGFSQSSSKLTTPHRIRITVSMLPNFRLLPVTISQLRTSRRRQAATARAGVLPCNVLGFIVNSADTETVEAPAVRRAAAGRERGTGESRFSPLLGHTQVE